MRVIQSASRLGLRRECSWEVAVHAISTFNGRTWGHALAWNGRTCCSSGQWSTAAFSTRATSAYQHPAITRPGTCSPYEGSGVDAGAAREGPATASGAPQQDSGLVRSQSESVTAGACSADSCDQR